MEEILLPIIIVLGPMWIVFHYVTQWKKMKVMSADDEMSFGELHQTAERLETRLRTLERILDDEVPDWRSRHHDV